MMLATSVGTQLFITGAINRADAAQTLSTASDGLSKAVDAYDSAVGQSETATSNLLSELRTVETGLSPGRGRAVIAAVDQFVSVLDGHVSGQSENERSRPSIMLWPEVGVVLKGRTGLDPVSAQLLISGVVQAADAQAGSSLF
jgi:hypothetical protein